MRRLACLLWIACLAAFAAGTAGARTASFTCAVVPSSLIRTALGVNVGALAIKHQDGALYCTYPVNGVPDAVHVIYSTRITTSNFNGQKPPGVHAHAIRGLGNAAFGYSLGRGPYGQSLVSVLKGTSELTIAGQGVSLAKATALARRLLPHF
jgi:hypothetical protein